MSHPWLYTFVVYDLAFHVGFLCQMLLIRKNILSNISSYKQQLQVTVQRENFTLNRSQHRHFSEVTVHIYEVINGQHTNSEKIFTHENKCLYNRYVCTTSTYCHHHVCSMETSAAKTKIWYYFHSLWSTLESLFVLDQSDQVYFRANIKVSGIQKYMYAIKGTCVAIVLAQLITGHPM